MLWQGSCLVTSDGAMCNCEPGYTGRRCMELLPSTGPCDPNICRNGGTCYVIRDKGLCGCQSNYTGDICQFNINPDQNQCNQLNCLHGGVCQVSSLSLGLSYGMRITNVKLSLNCLNFSLLRGIVFHFI